MTNLQMLLMIAIPSILVLLSWQQANARSNEQSQGLHRRIDMLGQTTDQRIDMLEQTMDRRFDAVDRLIDAVERRLTMIETDQRQFFTVTGKLDGRIDEIARR